jgi:hypothetical protein
MFRTGVEQLFSCKRIHICRNSKEFEPKYETTASYSKMLIEEYKDKEVNK